MWFEPISAWFVALVGNAFPWLNEKKTKTLKSEDWANKDLYYQDVMNGVSAEQRIKNLEKGKYRLIESYPEPHRDPKTGKIIIENCQLYNADVQQYGAYQAQIWVKQGKYNLTPEELEKETERVKKHIEKLYSLL